MDRIRTLLLARTHVVVMDPDLVASASTRPTRDQDIERFEDELAQLGYVMSLDLATTIRRLPHQTLQEVRGWIYGTLAREAGARRPHVPLHRFPPGTPADAQTPYLRRITTWLSTRPEQPCPWCGQVKAVNALKPCGHLVCRSCWAMVSFASCPICHRRVTLGEPPPRPAAGERVVHHDGLLTLLDLGLDLAGIAKARFSRLLARITPLTASERAEVETVIDAIGPAAMAWLPERIPVRETMAIAIARLVLISPNRSAAMRELAGHVKTATDVLRIAAVLMGANAELDEPLRFGSLGRGLRRALLEAIERLPLEEVVEDLRRRPRLWKRVGERLHPFEHAEQLPNTTLAFAALRGTNLATASFGEKLRERAVRLPFLYVEDDRVRPIAWAAPVEAALRLGNPRSALARLTHRPGELLRRADHLVRSAQSRQPDALQTIVKAVELAAVKGPAATMLALASHVARRGRPWSRRVFFPRGDVLHAWTAPDLRTPLRGDAIAVIVGAIRRQLLLRAETRRQFPRAVIDRALVDLPLPLAARSAPPTAVLWPRGSELALPPSDTLRLFLHWEEPAETAIDLDLAAVLFDASWRHVATCDAGSARVGDGAAVHGGDRTSAPAPLGATESIDLHLERLALLGARHLVMVVLAYAPMPLERLTHAFAGVCVTPDEGRYLDPRAVAPRFDLHGRALITVPLVIDLAERRLYWLDVRIRGRNALAAAGGYHAALAHLGRDLGDSLAPHARPTLWDVACIHAAARGNVIYVRERDGSFTTYRRRDAESKISRLARLMSGGSDDGRVAAIPVADAPTWFALVGGMPMPKGSTGFVLAGRGTGSDVQLVSAGDLIAELDLP